MKYILLTMMFSLVTYAADKVEHKYFYVEPVSIEKSLESRKVVKKVVVNERLEQEKEELDGLLDLEDELPLDDELPSDDEIVEKPKVMEKETIMLIPDEDGDGVMDKDDICPNTPLGFKVTPEGCPKTATLKVTFAADSYEIAPKMVQKLESFAQFLKENKNYQVVIYGYTDSRGEYEENKKLSQERANSVKDALMQLGVSSSKLTAIGRGEDNPIASNMYKVGRKQNRRIEAELIY